MTLNSLLPHENSSDSVIASVEATAEKELGAFFRGELPPAPTVEPTPTVTEPPATPQVPVQAQPPVESGAPTPTPVEPSVNQPQEDSVSKKVKEIFGDDPVRAAEAILATNNRAAAMATKLKELGLDPKTLQPLLTNLQPSIQEPPAPVEQVDQSTIDAETTRLLDNDPAFVSLVQTWISGDNRIKEISSTRSTLEDDIKKISFAMDIPEIKADDFKRDQYASQLAAKEQTLLKLQLEEGIIEAKQERLNAAAARFTERARGVVNQHFQAEFATRQEEADLAQYQQELYAQYSTSWPLAVERAIADAKIPAELVNDFKEDAKVAALAHLQDTDTAIDNLYQFVGNRAKVMMERLDRFHRMQSATYGAQAAVRTALPTSSVPSSIQSPGIASPPSPQAPSTSTVSFERALEIESALIAKQMGLWA